MLDDLKKERVGFFGAQERVRLSLYVAGLLLLGCAIFAGARSASMPSDPPPENGVPAVDAPPDSAGPNGRGPEDAVAQAPTLNAVEIDDLVRASGAEPDGWATPAIERIRSVRRAGHLGRVAARPTAAELAAANGPASDAAGSSLRGRVVEVLGRVVALAREEYRPRLDSSGSERLWTVVLEDPQGARFLALKYALASDPGEGPPTDTKPPQIRGELIAPDHWVLVRGVYFQDRVGSVADERVPVPTPTLFATDWRIVVPPDQRNPDISELDEALWGDVQDRFMRHTRNWQEAAAFETIRWARRLGHAQIKAMLDSGELPWERWETERFAKWKKEVQSEEEDAPRPFTEGSRGRVYRLAGVVGSVLQFGWDSVPRNAWGVEEFELLTMLTDHYQTVSFRSFVPFPMASFDGVEGKPAEHLYVYGVFVKNFTYDSKFRDEDGSGRARPVTMPMFVILHAEPYPEEAAAERIRSAMFWVAVGMVVFALFFYFVLIRGDRQQERRMEEHRIALRRRARAKNQGATADPSVDGDG
ncbi:MAG: hypothetical protein O2894_14045 [Planctomycetota bacterium]|nr:hypothetical protein [Planctomycetota bacterium]